MTKVTCLFYPVRSKERIDKRCPLNLRVTIESRRSEMSLGKFIDPLMWSDQAQTVRGKSDEAIELNMYLTSLRATVQRIQLQYLERKEILTAELLKEELTGKPEELKTFLVGIGGHEGSIRGHFSFRSRLFYDFGDINLHFCPPVDDFNKFHYLRC